MTHKNVTELIDAPQFTFTSEDRVRDLLPVLQALTEQHTEKCDIYGDLLKAGGLPNPEKAGLASLPYLPVRSFKELELRSIPEDAVAKVLTSSGTTGQAVSRIFLDSDNATLQQKALASIMRSVLGDQRLPMLIVDTPSILKNRATFSARGAGVLGMMTFGRAHTWLLNDDMELDRSALRDFLATYGSEKFLIFGFTFMAWQYLCQELAPGDFDMSNGILVHSGGWKKLESEAVSPEIFNETWKTRTGLTHTRNFYGMVEQIGSIFVEGDDGWLYCPNFADVIIRNPIDWSVQKPGLPGVIEVISALPSSYPGHVLLTEDMGIAEPESDSATWKGTRFKVLGRLPKAELRGCSDTHAQQVSNATFQQVQS
jgi:hypothetical protein